MSKGRAKLAISHGLSVWALEVPQGFGDSPMHAHHAIQITVALTGELALADAAGVMAGKCLAVAADAPHRIEAEGMLGFVFVEPESQLGRALSARLFAGRDLAEIDEQAFLDTLRPLAGAFDGHSRESLLVIGEQALGNLVPLPPAETRDPRIDRIIDQATTCPDRSLAETAAAAGVHLSPERLRHLFVERTGLAFKTYMVWRRLMRALDVYSRGGSLTEAAHEAGFSDSAHFSRLFKRTFGLPATTLTRI
jgi:AraC-like DNA-binding protein